MSGPKSARELATVYGMERPRVTAGNSDLRVRINELERELAAARADTEMLKDTISKLLDMLGQNWDFIKTIK